MPGVNLLVANDREMRGGGLRQPRAALLRRMGAGLSQ